MVKRRLKKDLLNDIEVLQNQFAIAKKALKEIALADIAPKQKAHQTLINLGLIPFRILKTLPPDRVYIYSNGDMSLFEPEIAGYFRYD